jgi:tetratricopeptide (TPR) repeat protein
VAAGSVVLLAWLYRSGDGESRPLARITRHHLATLLLYAGVAATAVAAHLGYLAAPYEPSVSYLLIELPFAEHLAYPYSVLTQTGLFFKYLLLWLVPNAAWMSVDMREPIAQGWWPYGMFALAMALYLLISLRLLWRGGEPGLWGMALLLPLILFATEFATVRIQEPFVLYRSYLWMPLSFGLAFALFVSRFRYRMAIGLTAIVALAFAAFSANQLYTFSQPLFIWDQAAKLVENRPNLLGLDRIYHNRGQAFYDLGIRDQAMRDYNKAIEIAPILPYSYNNRGALYLDMRRYDEALADFNKAISISRSANPLMGRGLVYKALGKTDEARADFDKACKSGFRRACVQLEKLPR